MDWKVCPSLTRGGGEIESDLLGSFEDLWNVGNVVGSNEGLGYILRTFGEMFKKIGEMFKKLLSWIAAKIKALFAARPNSTSTKASNAEKDQHIDVIIKMIPQSNDIQFISHMNKYFDTLRELNKQFVNNVYLDEVEVKLDKLVHDIEHDYSFTESQHASILKEEHYTSLDSLDDEYQHVVKRMKNLENDLDDKIKEFNKYEAGVSARFQSKTYEPSWASTDPHRPDFAGNASGTEESVEKYKKLKKSVERCSSAILRQSTWYFSKLVDVANDIRREYNNAK